MNTLSEILALDFMRNAILAAALASVLCGVIGTFVVVKRLVFISGGVSHAAFGGLGACWYLGLPPLLGALVVAVASALLLGGKKESRRGASDAFIGVLWAVGMAVGMVFIHLTPGYAPDLSAQLFGDLLSVGSFELQIMLGLTVVVLAVVIAYEVVNRIIEKREIKAAAAATRTLDTAEEVAA